jgi:hypothetical protein
MQKHPTLHAKLLTHARLRMHVQLAGNKPLLMLHGLSHIELCNGSGHTGALSSQGRCY